ncbi:extracellular solute-binding protein [Clostridium sp. UBA1652]|uniref:extracellular solute-binding protein n=1 Tax=Clostridium sp. UBA1652 TaxID=1946348 RepID=UPI00257AF055|nr:extracellular solute-binding protein [Clostridium sp. UBA1652]
MATIKEVAMAAGVSVGTVSNVINGKTNNAEIIEKVEKVIRELGFRPDAKARSLKSTETYLIGVIVNNMEDRSIQLMTAAIEKELRSFGYSIVIKTTDNNEVLENKYIEYFIQLGVDGIIVNTSVKRKKWLEKLKELKIPVVLMNKSVHLESSMDIIQVNYEPAFMECFEWSRNLGFKRIGIVLEKGIINKEKLKDLVRKTDIDIIYKFVGDHSAESGFKAAYEILYENEDIDVIIIGGYMLSKGANKAIEVFEEEKKIHKVCIKTENWIEDDNVFDALIEVSNYEIGYIASHRMIEIIGLKGRSGTNINTVKASFKIKEKAFYNGSKFSVDSSNTLHVAILNAETANVLTKLSKVYEKENGIKIEYHSMKYRELWKLVSNPEKLKESGIDIFMYDVIWKEVLANTNALEDISNIKDKNLSYFSDFIDDIVDNYGVYDGKLYGLPFLTGTQLLFYQKDLFEDNSIKLQFQRRYGYELNVPSNWNEFNEIAEFFTREFNDRSPVKYGTALINQGNLYNSIEFLNRLWSYEGKFVEDNKIALKSLLVKIAIEDYKKSFKYIKKDEIIESWEDIASIFKSGEVAMTILYDSYAFGINDSMESKVVGNIGSAMIPGKSPVLGGWGLGLNSNSETKILALDFMMWACGKRIGNPFAVLSGISSRKSFYLNKDLDGLYPWKSKVLESYAQSKIRGLLKGYDKLNINIKLYDEILGKYLGKIVRDEINIDEAIKIMGDEINNIMK